MGLKVGLIFEVIYLKDSKESVWRTGSQDQLIK